MKRAVPALGVAALAAAAAACGGARTPAAGVAAPSPTGDAPAADVRTALAQAVDGGLPAWAAPGAQAAGAVRVAEAGDDALWYVPTASVWCVALQTPTPTKLPTRLPASCSPSDGSQPPLAATFAGDPLGRGASQRFLVYGWAAPPATRVELRFADGTSDSVPLQQGFFLWRADGVVPARPARLVARTSTGDTVAERALVDERTWHALQTPPSPATAAPPGDAQPVNAGDDSASISLNGDGTCQGWTLQGRTTASSYMIVGFTAATRDAADGDVSVFTTPAATAIMGDTGAGAASAALRLSDGSERAVPLHGRCVLVALARAEDTGSRHPTALRWRDAAGTAHDVAIDASWPTFSTDHP